MCLELRIGPIIKYGVPRIHHLRYADAVPDGLADDAPGALAVFELLGRVAERVY